MASEKLYPHLMPMPFLVTTSYGVQIHTLFRTATWEWGQGCWGNGPSQPQPPGPPDSVPGPQLPCKPLRAGQYQPEQKTNSSPRKPVSASPHEAQPPQRESRPPWSCWSQLTVRCFGDYHQLGQLGLECSGPMRYCKRRNTWQGPCHSTNAPGPGPRWGLVGPGRAGEQSPKRAAHGKDHCSESLTGEGHKKGREIGGPALRELGGCRKVQGRKNGVIFAMLRLDGGPGCITCSHWQIGSRPIQCFYSSVRGSVPFHPHSAPLATPIPCAPSTVCPGAQGVPITQIPLSLTSILSGPYRTCR